MVLEEKFVGKHNVPPLQAVGLEGVFGFVVLSILLVPMYYIPVGNTLFNNPGGQLEDALDGFDQISHNWVLLALLLGMILCISFLNFSGVTVTKELGATTRLVIGSLSTLSIWLITLGIGWQSFNFLQPIGFGVLVLGTALYNEIFNLRKCCKESELIKPLLEDDLEGAFSERGNSKNFKAPI